ncbi:MAG: amidase family protein [Pirellulales bacterium]
MWRLECECDAYRRRFWDEFAALDADAYLCPPHPLPALAHGSTDWLALAGGNCYLANLLDCPAGVVSIDRVRPDEESDRPESRDRVDLAAARVERGSAGLPVGVQIGAARWREDVVLAVMAALEESLPLPARTEQSRRFEQNGVDSVKNVDRAQAVD